MAQFSSAFNGLWEQVHTMLEVAADAGGRATKAMILAAGRGSRMGASEHEPKPLLEVGGEALIERHLRCLRQSGVDEVVINLCFGGERIRERIGSGERWRLRVQYSVEAAPPLETAGAIIAALPLLGRAPFLLVNADVFTDVDFRRLSPSKALGTLVLVDNPDHHRDGDYGLAEDGRLSASPPKLTFAGISILAPALFDGFAPGRRPLKPVLDRAVAQGELFGLRYDGLWLDVGTPERLRQARALADGLVENTPVATTNNQPNSQP